MDNTETYCLMLSNNHDPVKLTKIIGYINDDLQRLEQVREKYLKLIEVAEKRITQQRNPDGHTEV